MYYIKLYKSTYIFIIIFLSLFFGGCQEPISLPTSINSIHVDSTPTDELAKPFSVSELAQLGFNIPPDQTKGDELPPQPGSQVLGQTVKGGPGQDTNWTAFTLVLFKSAKSPSGYSILTQKRAIAPISVIETAGGHLVGGQTWRQGARDELWQEAGIKIDNNSLIFLQGGIPKISHKNKLHGNMNFFVVFNTKPPTNELSREIDKSYAHKWLDLKALFNDVQEEQQKQGYAHGKYFSFFRGQLLKFCTDVIKCEKL